MHICKFFCTFALKNKNIMKKLALMALISLSAVTLYAQKQNEVYLAYIDQWKDVAVQQQADYGIPASITLAQALLESAAGQSELAQNANNHFGIKCTNDWMGGVYYYDDERNGECFRQYRNAAESFKDHSLFLQRKRYETCFEIAVEDYEGWARRLRECGYATDKQYAPKLVKIIEDYHLDEIGAGKPVGHYDPDGEQALRDKEPSSGNKSTSTKSTDSKSTASKNTGPKSSSSKPVVVHATEPIRVIDKDPEPEYVEPLTAKQEKANFFVHHPKYRMNGVQYVIAREDDTYANVAFRLNVRERDLRVWNDALGRDMHTGERIYLSSKKNKGANMYVWTQPGQTVWELSQEEAVTIKAVRKFNGLDTKISTFTVRQKIYLQKVKEENGAR